MEETEKARLGHICLVKWARIWMAMILAKKRQSLLRSNVSSGRLVKTYYIWDGETDSGSMDMKSYQQAATGYKVWSLIGVTLVNRIM